MALSKYKLGDLIEQRREKNKGYNVPILGVSREGFIKPKQVESDTSLYNVFYKYDFVFNPARMELNSIVLNTDLEKAICSSLYEIFYIKRTDLLLPEYLNLFIKRDEFARLCSFLGSGSAREYCRITNISEIEIEIPPIEIQKKYVAIYRGLKYNLKVYESNLEDLRLVCDGYIENLRKMYYCQEVGPYIIRTDSRNTDNKIKNVKNVSVYKSFNEPTSKVNRDKLSNYKIVYPKEISFVQTTHNEKVFAYAINNTNTPVVVSSVNEVFKTDEQFILPEFLCLYFNRKEFDRYARFHSWGSARETFVWNDLQKVKIPIPPINIQRDIVNIYNAYSTRKLMIQKLKDIVNKICPILIRGAIKEANEE